MWHAFGSPQEVCDRIKAYVKPGRGRRLICETLDSVWDWKTFFQPLEIQVSGIAASPSKRDICHSKRFVSRMDLPQMVLPGWELETPQTFSNTTPGQVTSSCAQSSGGVIRCSPSNHCLCCRRPFWIVCRQVAQSMCCHVLP